jgi:D-3-phosphoglycerate dehydrogenase
VRHCWSPAVAEFALTLVLSGLRKASDYHAAMRAGTESWVNDFPGDIPLNEFELSGNSVGIVGFGAIGQRIAELLAPFKTDLRCYDPFLPDAVAAQYGAKKTELDELLSHSSVVILCAANSPDAEHLIGEQQIALLKRDALLVNVGRSMLIDMPALIARLQKGELTAMLDVFDREPLERESVLRSLSNVYCTPHRAGGLISSVCRALQMLTDDYEAFLAGKDRTYAVTQKMLHCFSN